MQELVKLIDPRDVQQDWMKSDHARLLRGLLRKRRVLVLDYVSTFACSPLPPVSRWSPRASTHEDWNQMGRSSDYMSKAAGEACWYAPHLPLKSRHTGPFIQKHPMIALSWESGDVIRATVS